MKLRNIFRVRPLLTRAPQMGTGAWFATLRVAVGLCAASALTGCIVEEEQSYDPLNNPGSHAWTTSEKVACNSDADCAQGEACEDQVCQMRRCADAYNSAPPLGSNRYFGVDGEVAVISDAAYIDGYETSGGTKYLDSWDLSKSGKVVDVAGGNLTGKRPRQIAAAIDFSQSLKIRDGKSTFDLPIGIVPKAIATGDVDADGVDEIVAYAADGTIALCRADKKSCQNFKISGKGLDVAVADVDGDGYEEPIFLTDDPKQSTLVIWNLDAKKTGQKETRAWTLSFRAQSMAAAVVHKGVPAEVALLEDGGWLGLKSDRLHLFSAMQENITSTTDVTTKAIDLGAGDRGSDGVAEIAVLRDDKSFELWGGNGMTGLAQIGTYPLSVGTTAARVSILDWDGDSASGRLTEGPVLVAGNAVPLAALMFPPFHAGAVDKPAVIAVGANDSTSTGSSHTVKLSVGLAVSFSAEVPAFKAEVGAHLDKEFSVTKTLTKTQMIGEDFWIESNPQIYGSDYGAVVMSCGCYHRYHYVTDDPAKHVGGSGQGVDIYIPVGGQTQLWSSKRYNAMAKAVKTLPVIPVGARVGDAKSYPTKIQAIDGQIIKQDDMVFPNPPTYQVSDVGDVGFTLETGKTETNETAQSTTIGVSGALELFGVGVESTIDIGVEQGYSIEVGHATSFGGKIPPIFDDPETPEDEFAVYHYGFTPFVYRQHYATKTGADAGYYVLYYAVK
jgi:hypothetical protein